MSGPSLRGVDKVSPVCRASGKARQVLAQIHLNRRNECVQRQSSKASCHSQSSVHTCLGRAWPAATPPRSIMHSWLAESNYGLSFGLARISVARSLRHASAIA